MRFSIYLKMTQLGAFLLEYSAYDTYMLRQALREDCQAMLIERVEREHDTVYLIRKEQTIFVYQQERASNGEEICRLVETRGL